MFLTKNIELKVTWSNIKTLIQYYPNIVMNDVITIEPKYLSQGSQIKIKFGCDICGIEKHIIYKDYIRFNKYDIVGYYICPTCKRVESTNVKYGVDNISQLDIIKEKKEQTSLEKYGKKYYSQTEEYLEQVKKTNNDRYGVDWTSQNKEIKEKQIKTNIEKYGYDNPSKNHNIQQKISDTNIITKNEKTFLNIKNLINIENNNFTIKCNENHDFVINRILYYKRNETHTTICTVCNPINKNVSGLEIQISNFIKEIYNGEIILNSKEIIKPYELDIYLPTLNLAFEFNGVYWHNELNKPKNYHKIKTDLCEEQNIHLFHIWEDDWLYKQDIIKSMILNKIGLTQHKIFARKCEIKIVTDNKLIKDFLNLNHIQGYVVSNIKIGLYYKDELVSIMIFNQYNNNYELVRFCNKINTSVIGGASKLFNYFKRTYIYNTISTFSDRCYSNGGLYYKLGFKKTHRTDINYYYVVDGIRFHKSNYKKSKLIKEGFDPNLSEHEIMLKRNIYRIYNSGNDKFIYE